MVRKTKKGFRARRGRGVTASNGETIKKHKKKWITTNGLKNAATTAGILGLGLLSLVPTYRNFTSPAPPVGVPHML